jgi:anti-sigma B factor antagonist
MREFSVEITPRDDNGFTVLKTAGSINSSTAPKVDAKLEELMSKGTYTIVVDFADTDFISSSGIGVFLGTVARLRDKGGDLILMNMPKLIDDIFEVLNIKSYFRIVKTIDELRAPTKS